MINLVKTLAHLEIPLGSISRALQVVRGKLERASSESAGASKFIKSLLDVDIEFSNNDKARIVTFAVVKEIFRLNGIIEDVNSVIQVGVKEAEEFINKPANSFMFSKDVNIVKPIKVKIVKPKIVSVNPTNGLKRGDGKIIALQLYKREAQLSPAGVVNSGEFTKLLMKELGMTTVGARTYTYNTKKLYLAELS